jgi:hypothetical protein
MHATFPILDPFDVVLVLLAGIGLVLGACAIGFVGARLRDLIRAALLRPRSSPQ